MSSFLFFFFFFFNDTATTEIYTVGNTLSLHDALPSWAWRPWPISEWPDCGVPMPRSEEHTSELQSLPTNSYAVFCLKKKKKTKINNSSQFRTDRTIKNISTS